MENCKFVLTLTLYGYDELRPKLVIIQLHLLKNFEENNHPSYCLRSLYLQRFSFITDIN